MGGLLSPDGIVYKIGTVIADVIILGLLWLLASLPLVTMGAATTGIYYVATKKINGRDIYLWRDFWRSFRQNFVQSTLVFITLVAVYALLVTNMRNIWLVDGLQNFFLAVQFFVFIEITFIAMYAFPLMARIELGYVQIFKTAFLMANRHIFTTLSNLILMAGIAFLVLEIIPLFFLFFMGIYCYFSSFLIVKVLKKYRPDLDPELVQEPLKPLQLEEVAKLAKSGDCDEENEQSYYDNSSGVLNLDRLKSIREDKNDDKAKGDRG